VLAVVGQQVVGCEAVGGRATKGQVDAAFHDFGLTVGGHHVVEAVVNPVNVGENIVMEDDEFCSNGHHLAWLSPQISVSFSTQTFPIP
jgi:hypothetical protein